VLIALAAGLVVGAGGGLGFGWRFWRQQPLPQEIAAPAVRQKDSSLVLQRAPDAHAKPQQIIPKGATVERIEHIVVQPKAILPAVPAASSDSMKQTDSARAALLVPEVSRETPIACPPVRVDLTLYRLADKTQRVVASSPDGTVLDSLSVDTPVERALPPPKILRWSAGPLYGGSAARWGAAITYDLGPFRPLVAVMQGPKAGGAIAFVGANIRF
jgi:hypothetical protein